MRNMQKNWKAIGFLGPLLAVGLAGCATVEETVAEAVSETKRASLTGAEIAQRLNIKPPLVSRWLSPTYHQHGMETLRRIADALDMDVEVKLKPRERQAAS